MKLFYDDEFDALNQAIGNSGKSRKEVAAHLFPDKPLASAITKLSKCCSADGDERLTFGQVLRLMEFCGQYDPLIYLCDETWHARPDRKSREDETVNLVEVIRAAGDQMERAMRALKHIEQRNGIRVAA